MAEAPGDSIGRKSLTPKSLDGSGCRRRCARLPAHARRTISLSRFHATGWCVPTVRSRGMPGALNANVSCSIGRRNSDDSRHHLGTLYTDVHGGSSCRVGRHSRGELDAYGCAVLPKLLSPEECRGMAVLYPDERHFRSHVHMARHGFGKVIPLLQIPVARSARRSSHDALSASCRRGQRMERADGRRRALSR